MNLSENDIWRPLGRFIVFSLLFILLIFSCSRKKIQKKSSLARAEYVSDYAVLKEAKYSDVPIPIGYQFVELQKVDVQTDKKTDFLCYLGDLPLEQVIDYYHKNMERYGWQIADFSTQQEGLLFCSKGNKDCIVSIRKNIDASKSNFKKNYVCLFIKNKSSVEDSKKDINSKKIPDIDFIL